VKRVIPFRGNKVTAGPGPSDPAIRGPGVNLWTGSHKLIWGYGERKMGRFPASRVPPAE
jgi:hypothetical protein